MGDLPKWIADHLQRYLDIDGADGHLWDSAPVGDPGPTPTLLLTTTGRRESRRRSVQGGRTHASRLVSEPVGAPGRRGTNPRQAIPGHGADRERRRTGRVVEANGGHLSAV